MAAHSVDLPTPPFELRNPTTRPKQKRRAVEHGAGGQLFDDLPLLHERIDGVETRKIYSRAVALLATSPSAQNSILSSDIQTEERIVNLRSGLITCVGWFRNARNDQRRPSPSEIGERLRSVEVAINSLWKSLGLPADASKAARGEIAAPLLRLSPFLNDELCDVVEEWGKQCDAERYLQFGSAEGFSTDLRRLEEALATQSDPSSALRPVSPYSSIRIFEVIIALQHLALWVGNAQLRMASAKVPGRARQPDLPLYRMNWELSKIYRSTFNAEPTETTGGPWLTFLGDASALAGEDHRSSEALRQLWRNTRRIALASPR